MVNKDLYTGCHAAAYRLQLKRWFQLYHSTSIRRQFDRAIQPFVNQRRHGLVHCDLNK